MNTTLFLAGFACIIAAAVGGGFKAFGIEIPVLNSKVRQIVLGLIGIVLVTIFWPKQQPLQSHPSTGQLALAYVGASDTLVSRRVDKEHTPNNDFVKDNCPREVPGKDPISHIWCVSRTQLSLEATPPHVFRNASATCSGIGCQQWIELPNPTISANGHRVSDWIDNWGKDVDATLIADEFDHVSAVDCGIGATQTVPINGTTVFRVPTRCIPVAEIQWTLEDGSQGAVKVGQSDPGLTVALEGNPIISETEATYTYKRLK